MECPNRKFRLSPEGCGAAYTGRHLSMTVHVAARTSTETLTAPALFSLRGRNLHVVGLLIDAKSRLLPYMLVLRQRDLLCFEERQHE